MWTARSYGTSSPSILLSTTTATRPGTMSNPPESQPLELNEAPMDSGFWSTAYNCDVSLCLHLATSAQLLRAESKTSGDAYGLCGENRVSRGGSAVRGRGRIVVEWKLMRSSQYAGLQVLVALIRGVEMRIAT